MIDARQLADAFALNLRIIQMQTEGLSHADTLLQLPFRGNCLNWVLGHIAVSRDRVLRLLGEEPLLGEAESTRYDSDSPPVTGEGEDVVGLERLLELLHQGQAAIAAGLGSIATEELTREVTVGGRTTTVGQRLFGLYFHDTYHTGQTELLRQLAGTNDQVI